MNAVLFWLDRPCVGRYIAPTLRLGRSQVVRHRFLVPCIVGSNPTAPANLFRPLWPDCLLSLPCSGGGLIKAQMTVNSPTRLSE